jgi:hypothetical protein
VEEVGIVAAALRFFLETEVVVLVVFFLVKVVVVDVALNVAAVAAMEVPAGKDAEMEEAAAVMGTYAAKVAASLALVAATGCSCHLPSNPATHFDGENEEAALLEVALDLPAAAAGLSIIDDDNGIQV